MSYADVSLSNAEAHQHTITPTLNYNGAFNVGGIQKADFTSRLDTAQTAEPRAVAAVGSSGVSADGNGGGLLSNGQNNLALYGVAGVALISLILAIRRK